MYNFSFISWTPLRYVRFYPGVNSRAELVTLAPGLTVRPERRFAQLAREIRLPCETLFESLGFAFPVNGERQVVTVAAKFSFSHFVSYFLSNVNLKQQDHYTLRPFSARSCLCPPFVVLPLNAKIKLSIIKS